MRVVTLDGRRSLRLRPLLDALLRAHPLEREVVEQDQPRAGRDGRFQIAYQVPEEFWPSMVGRRVITTAGVNYLAACFTNTNEAENFNWHEFGTGTTAEAVGQTALITPSGVARVSGTQSTPGSTNVYQSQATTSFTSALAITEHGIFSAVTGGTLLDRTLFSAEHAAFRTDVGNDGGKHLTSRSSSKN